MILSGMIHSRQAMLIAERLRDAEALIYGAGMLGSWTAQALTRVANIVTVYDGADLVEDVNLGTQAYTETDIGMPKGLALAGHTLNLNVEQMLFPPNVPMNESPSIVVSCADSMEARRAGAVWARDNDVPLFIDTRARGLEATIVTVTGAPEYYRYLGNLPSDDDIENVPCGMNGTAFVGMFVASRVASLCNIFCREGAANLPIRETWNVERALIIEREYRDGRQLEMRMTTIRRG